MKYLKYVLIIFFIVDSLIFLISQINPELLLSLLPQFDLNTLDNTYIRTVGVLFLMLGLARLYGGVYLHEKGALIISMWSWIVELIYVITEIFYDKFLIDENILSLVIAPLMFIWSLFYYIKSFKKNKI
ncbi:hypothetical protein UJ101_00031 [Flavobacteriaceae bacterium UJ101]|nr:hypothetical protein UJ101_00031 [Flavobacteriaceae bacterium UJ101]